jgi:hypothetical protein
MVDVFLKKIQQGLKMTDTEKTAILTADKAHSNYEKTIQARANIEGNFIVLGLLLQESQKDSLYKFIGYDTFNEYLGAPELGFKRSTAYRLISLINLYVDKLKVPAVRLIGVGSTKLGAISKVVENDVEGWLSKAEHLSKSSLDEEISGRGPGEKSLPPFSPPPPVPAPSSRMTPDQYLGLVKSSPCVNCGATETVVPAHFPRTRVRCEKPWHVIPLCYKCHTEQEGSSKWCWDYRGNWAKWFYDLIAGE